MVWTILWSALMCFASVLGFTPNGYSMFSEEAGGWMKLYVTPKSWSEARRVCYLEGGMLAAPTSIGKLTSLRDLLEHHTPPTQIYTGFTDEFVKGVYYSLDGISVEDMPLTWQTDHPRLNHYDLCIIMNRDGILAFDHCDNFHSYVCFFKYEKKIPLNSCGTTDPGYIASNCSGSCYKYHSHPKNWSDAYKTCAIEGGYLAIPDYKDEAKLFREKVEGHKGIIFVGIRYIADLKQWQTIHGSPIENHVACQWAKGQPRKRNENGNHGWNCGGLNVASTVQDPGLNDVLCDTFLPFLCEKEPQNQYVRKIKSITS